MPNRMIRDGILESEAVLSLPVEARWLFVTIMLSADDLGLFEATEFKLARRADINRDLAGRLLLMLADSDLIRLYEVGGKRYGFIPKFRQRIQIKSARYPLPPTALYSDDGDASKKINNLASKTTDVQPMDNGYASAAQPPEAKAKEESLSSLRSDRDKPRKRGSPSLQKPMATVDDLVAAGFHPDLAAEFINHKASVNAPLTVRAWHDHLREARKAGWSPAQAAEKVIARNWKGFDASYVLKGRSPSSQSMNAHKHAAAAKAIFDGVFDD